MSYEFEYLEFHAHLVASTFAKNIKAPSGKKIKNYDWFFDPAKQTFIYRLTVDKSDEAGADMERAK